MLGRSHSQLSIYDTIYLLFYLLAIMNMRSHKIFGFNKNSLPVIVYRLQQ